MENQHEEQEKIEELTTEAVSEASEESITLNEEKVEEFIAQKRKQQNLPLAIGAGLVAALVSAVIWAAVTVSTGYQIGYMAIAVGFIVGFAVRLGRGMDITFGIVGAALSLLGCLIGNFLSMVGFAANDANIGYTDVLSVVDFAQIPGIMIDTLQPMDFLFYGIALYFGFKYGTVEIDENELIEATRD